MARRPANSSQQATHGRSLARRFRASCFADSGGSLAGTWRPRAPERKNVGRTEQDESDDRPCEPFCHDPANGQSGLLLRGRDLGYTHGMKTAVSIPDDVFEQVERLARRAKRSRSEVFSAALREYVARHAPDEVTEALNRAVDQVGQQPDEFVAKAARRILEKTEW